MESQPSVSGVAAEDYERQAGLQDDLVLTILIALPQGEWEKRVNEREIRYLQLLEQRIEILERTAEAPGNRPIPRRPRRTRTHGSNQRSVERVRQNDRNYY